MHILSFHSLSAYLFFVFHFFTPPFPSAHPSPPAESCFLIVMLMAVMMVDCPRLPGGQFGRTVTLAKCPPITWPSALSVATHIPSQVCLHVCVILHYCICACFSISYALLQNFLQLLSNWSICPIRPCFFAPPPLHGLQFAQLQKWRCAFSRSNTSPALLEFCTPLLCCVIIMSGRER